MGRKIYINEITLLDFILKYEQTHTRIEYTLDSKEIKEAKSWAAITNHPEDLLVESFGFDIDLKDYRDVESPTIIHKILNLKLIRRTKGVVDNANSSNIT